MQGEYQQVPSTGGWADTLETLTSETVPCYPDFTDDNVPGSRKDGKGVCLGRNFRPSANSAVPDPRPEGGAVQADSPRQAFSPFLVGDLKPSGPTGTDPQGSQELDRRAWPSPIEGRSSQLVQPTS